MTRSQPISRRSFLGAAMATAESGQVERQQAAASISGETDHFWYRTAPAGKYVDSQRGNRAFAYGDGWIFLSSDNGRSWPRSLAFPDARLITFSYILKNGNILFATNERLFLSKDGLRSYEPVTVKARNGGDYVPHQPRIRERPGWYFHALNGVASWDVNGKEMLVWGNYCNVIGGAAPVNIYYSTDSGRTVKIAYSFGQNPYFADNGSPGGGKGGALLGDPDNPVLARHVHCVTYNPAENAFYACTGDGTRGMGHECHWLRGTYDAGRDLWNWKVLVSDVSNSRYKGGGINFVEGKMYWISDSNGPKPYDRGIFCCDPADLLHPEKHTRLFNPEVESANLIIQDGVMLASHCAPASPLDTGIIVSTDMGRSWAQYDLKELGRRSPTRFHRKNGEGWFRMDLRSEWITKAEVLFIKPKPAAHRKS